MDLIGSIHHGPAQLSRLTWTCSVPYVAVGVHSSLGCHRSDRLNTSRAGRAQYVAMGLLGAVGALLSSERCDDMDLLGSERCPRRAQLFRLSWTCAAPEAAMGLLGSVGALLGSGGCHWYVGLSGSTARLSRLPWTCWAHQV